MEDKKKLSHVLANKGKAAKDILGKTVERTVHVMDQNDDGKFDLGDVSVVVETLGNSAKKGAQVVKGSLDERTRQVQLKALRPIFVETLDDADFSLPKFIRITERDKKFSDKDICHGSIGRISDQKGLHMIDIFRDSIDAFALSFYPDRDSDFYYVDPSDRGRYIALDDYFSYLKVARINELQKIAQDLGAKYFKVTYKEEQTSFSEKKGSAHTKASSVSAEGSGSASEKRYSAVEIAAEMTFPGHDPIKPELKYMQRDPSIQTLVSMRMDASGPMLRQKFMLKMSSSSGIKEKDAIKIDAVLKGLKCSGNATVTNEVKNESRRYLEYEIEF